MEQIIALTAQHLDECTSLYASVFSSPPWNEQWSENAAKQRLYETFATPGFVGFGYMIDGQLQGFITGNTEQWLNSRLFYLKEMCISSRYQGKGIGKKLLQHLKESNQQQGINKIYLMTKRDTPALQFYLSQGFALSEKMVVMGCSL